MGAGGGVGERAGERHKMPPDYFVRGSLETCKQSARLAPQIQTALRHKSEIEHHRNKIRLRAKRRGHYEFPVLDELSSGDTRERHRVYRRAQMQIDKILDPTASVPSVFIEPRKRWACCRGGGTLWKTPGGREGATPPGHHLWGARTVWAASRRLFVLFQSSGKLEKAEILEMTVQYLRALHSADFPRGREKGGQGVCATQSPAGGSGSKAVSQGLLSGC